MDKSEKISWFEQFKIACLKPSQYKRLLNLAKGKVILFLAAITLITTILGYGMDVAGFTVSVGGWKNFILNRLPAFELKDGTLSVDQEMDFEIGGVHFVADTSKDKVSTEDFLVDGFLDWSTAEKDHASELNWTTQYKWNVGKHISPETRLYLGVEHSVWNNKFGIKGSDENNVSALVKYHF